MDIKKEDGFIDQLVFESIIDNFPGHLYWLDKELRFLGCNNSQAKSAGLLSRYDIVGKKNSELPWASQAEALDKINQLVMDTGKYSSVEETAKNAEGDIRSYISKKLPLFSRENEIIGILGISFDVTELKEAQEALKKSIEKSELANKFKTEFIKTVSHEIRSPLAIVVSLISIVMTQLKELGDERAFVEYLKEADVHARETIRIMDNISKFLKLDSMKESYKKTPVIISNEFNKILSSIEFSEGVSTSLSINDNVPKVISLSASGFFDVIRIVLSNASKYTKKGTVSVFIETIDKNNNKVLSVNIVDTGCGIKKEMTDVIFSAFSYTEDLSKKYRNPGIKLSIAKKTMELLSGDIFLESDEFGTRFKIHIPMDFVSDKVEKTVLEGEKNQLFDLGHRKNMISECGTNKFKRKILLIEDSESFAKATITILENLGCSVIWVKLGLSAVEIVKTNKFDIVLTDISLPDINGVEAHNRIRPFLSENAIVVALTSHASEDDIEYYMENGMTSVLCKPTTSENFFNLLINYEIAIKNIDD